MKNDDAEEEKNEEVRLTTLPSATTLRKVEGLRELEDSSTSSSARSAAAWRIESASSDKSSIAAMDDESINGS